jgi:hypothetical protein
MAERRKESASWFASDKFTILDDDDAVAGTQLPADGLSIRGHLHSGDGPTDEDDTVAGFGVHDRDSAGEMDGFVYECTEEKNRCQEAIG